MMKNGVCLLADKQSVLEPLLPMLARCGLSAWTARSAEDFLSDVRASRCLCLVVDLPGTAGLGQLEALRRSGAREPAILISDAALPADRVLAVSVLDVFSKPVDRRGLMSWIECVCAANLVLERQRLARAA